MPRGDAYKRSHQKHLDNQKLKREREELKLFTTLVKENSQEALKKIAKNSNPKLLNSYLRKSKTTLTDFVNLKDKDGNNILHLAVQNGNKELIKYLTETQAVLNLPNNRNETPLHLAARIGNAEAFAQLIQAGAKQDVIDKDGLTPIQRVMGLKDEYIDSFLNIPEIDLNVKNQKGETALHRAIDIQDFSGANKLIAKGVGINAQDNKGRTALHLLVVKEYPTEELNEQIEKMIHSGADLFLPDSKGNTAFSDAIVRGKIGTVEKLISITKTKIELTNDEKKAIIELAKISRHDYDIPKIADALGVRIEQQKEKEPSKSDEIPDQNALHSVRDDSKSVDALHSVRDGGTERSASHSLIDVGGENDSSLSVTTHNGREPSFQTKINSFLEKLENEYGKDILTPAFLYKVKDYIKMAELKDGKITHNETKYNDYLKGQARKGKSHKFAELISGVRNTDNQMIQEITKQFNEFATQDNPSITLPKRYVKIQSTRTK